MRPSRAWTFRLLLSSASLLFTLLLLEIGIRLFVAPAYWQFRDASEDWQLDSRLGWVPKPHLDVSARTEQGWLVRFRTNGDGMTPASAVRARSPGVLRILIVGDSTVVGRSVPQDQTIHAHLERQLRAHGLAAEVYNAGVEGYSTDQALIRMRELVPLYHPDIVVYGFCGNDFGGNASSEAYGFPKPRFTLSGGVLHEKGPDLARLQRTNPLAGGPRSWMQHSALYRLLRPSIVSLRARWGHWEQRNLLITGADLLSNPAALEQFDWPLLSALLREMDRTARSHGARFLFYAHPDIAEVWNPLIKKAVERAGPAGASYDRFGMQRILSSTARAITVEFCGVIETFISRQSRGPFHLLPRDPHCNPAGYEVTAEALTKCLLEPSLPESRPQSAPSSQAGTSRRSWRRASGHAAASRAAVRSPPLSAAVRSPRARPLRTSTSVSPTMTAPRRFGNPSLRINCALASGVPSPLPTRTR